MDPAPETPESPEAPPEPAPDEIEQEARAIRATLAIWYSLPLFSADRVQSAANHHFRQRMQAALKQAQG